MAPEQVRGQPADHRADIFALAPCSTKCSAASRAFQGDTPADTMSAILRAEPSELPLVGGKRDHRPRSHATRLCWKRILTSGSNRLATSSRRSKRSAVGPGATVHSRYTGNESG